MRHTSINFKKIVFIVPPEVQLLDLTGPIHAFYEAKEYGALLDLQFASIYQKPETITSCAGIQFTNLSAYNEIELSSGDYIFVPGITFSLFLDANFISKSKDFLKWLKKQSTLNVNICSVCTGSFLLAEAGILDNKTCTTHWKRIDDFVERYPTARVLKNKLFVEDQNVYTSAGIASGIDLALYIIEKEKGIKFAIDIAKEMVVYFRRGENDSQISAYLNHRNHMDNRIHNAQNYIMDNIEKSNTIGDVADYLNMSVRNLTRLFKNTTGITVSAYRENLRIELALKLLAEKNTLETVTKSCGLKSIHHLRTLLKKHKGKLPSEL